MDSILSSPFFGIVLSSVTYSLGWFINRKTKISVLNPLLIAIILSAGFLLLFDIPYEYYNSGGQFISMFLTPATAALALSMYRQSKVLRENLIPLVCGVTAGSLTSMGCVFGLCRLFGIDEIITTSMLSKSLTAPIAMEVSAELGGEKSITIAAVVITGIFGSVASPLMVKLFRINNSVAAGAAIGTCSHAAGTSRAVEMGETEGAMSGIAIGLTGVITVLFTMLIKLF